MSIMDVFEAVVKADDAAGAAFIDAVVYDFLADEAQACRKDLTGLYSLVSLDRIQLAKRQLGREYVAKMVEGEYPDEGFQKAAQWLAGLEGFVVSVQKDMEWFTFGGQSRRQVDVERDARGRFSRKISSTPVNLDQRGKGGRPYAPVVQRAMDYNQTNNKTLDPGREAELRSAQGQHEAAIDVADDFKRAFRPEQHKDIQVEMMVARSDGSGGMDVVTRSAPLSDFKRDGLPAGMDINDGERLFAMSVHAGSKASPQTINAVGAYNLMGEQGGAAMASLASVDPTRLKNLQQSLGMDASPDASRLTRLFNQLGAGGQVLSQVTGQEKLGNAAAFVGSVGPQAEQVLGPYAQRAAYRYRGTEQTPNPSLVGAFRSPDMAAVDALADNPQQLAEAGRGDSLSARPFGDRSGSGNKGQGSLPLSLARSAVEQGLSGDSLKMQVRADLASTDLAQKIPGDPMVARLSELSGQVLPSQGILIDADGKVVSQSVGFTDDHYLPFDLKNLGKLRGGQYARTRMSGGLTGEDIYAAVTMGARQVQVVSPSGVFTLEMSPDFRGARGNSDKARGMYDRYLKILDAVDNSDQYLMDISPQEKSTIRSQVRDAGLKGEDAKIAIEERIDSARRNATAITDEDERNAQRKVMEDMGLTSEAQITANGQTQRTYEENLSDEIERVRSLKANKLRLNGQGYEMAMRTLQQQYPAFIKRVSYRSLNDFASTAGLSGSVPKGRQYSTDSGYAKPGSLRAQGVRAGFYERGTLLPGPKELPGERGREERARAKEAETAANKPAGPEGGETKPAEAKTTAEPEAKPAAALATVALSGRMSKKLPAIEKQTTQALETLADELGGFNMSNDTTMEQSWDQAIKGSKANFVSWLVSQDAATTKEIFADRNKALRAATIMSDETAVKTALKSVTNATAGNLADYLGAGNTLFGESDEGKATEKMMGFAHTVADGLLLSSGAPFIAGGNVWNGANDGDTALPQAFPNLSAINQYSAVEDFHKQPENEVVSALAETLMVDRTGEYQPLMEMNKEAVRQLKAFKAMKDAKAKIGPDTTNQDVFDDIDRDAFTLALGGMPASSENFAARIRTFDAEAKASELQRAWSLAMTTRLIEALEVGEAVPKAGSRLFGKAAPTIEVLSKSHPLSQAVARRAAAGLPFVPVRSGRVLAPRVPSRL